MGIIIYGWGGPKPREGGDVGVGRGGCGGGEGVGLMVKGGEGVGLMVKGGEGVG